MAIETFNDWRIGKRDGCAHGHNTSWCVFAGYDERSYAVTLQKSSDEREPMVRAGCRYLTLKNARKHYVSQGRNYSASQRRTAKQMLTLIGIAVSLAYRRGWLPNTVKFNSTPRKRRT